MVYGRLFGGCRTLNPTTVVTHLATHSSAADASAFRGMAVRLGTAVHLFIGTAVHPFKRIQKNERLQHRPEAPFGFCLANVATRFELGDS